MIKLLIRNKKRLFMRLAYQIRFTSRNYRRCKRNYENKPMNINKDYALKAMSSRLVDMKSDLKELRSRSLISFVFETRR